MPACIRPFALLLFTAASLGSPSHAQQPAPAPTPAAVTPAPLATAPAPAAAPMPNPAPVAKPTLTSPTDAAQQMIVSAVKKMGANDVDGALSDLTQALKLNPNSTGAYVLRASIYSQKHQWQQATDDFNSAARLAPTNVVIKFNLVELKFLQKQYDDARAGFVTLKDDPDMGDFAKYKVFLCDLLGGHQDAAQKELDVFNDVEGNPSYYFSNAAWDLYHKDIEGARPWLLSASRIYPLQKFKMYGQSLHDLGYLPIPEPKDQ